MINFYSLMCKKKDVPCMPMHSRGEKNVLS
jgi:hypothetical protein